MQSFYMEREGLPGKCAILLHGEGGPTRQMCNPFTWRGRAYQANVQSFYMEREGLPGKCEQHAIITAGLLI